MKHPVKVSEFLSVCSYLVEYSGKLVQQVHAKAISNNGLDIHVKGKNDLYTNADIAIQKLLTTNLKRLYPHLKIVGEEDALMDTVDIDKEIEELGMPDVESFNIRKFLRTKVLQQHFQERQERIKRYNDLGCG